MTRQRLELTVRFFFRRAAAIILRHQLHRVDGLPTVESSSAKLAHLDRAWRPTCRRASHHTGRKTLEKAGNWGTAYRVAGAHLFQPTIDAK